MENANLTGANFSGATLTGANFSGSNLSGVTFTNADVSSANFTNANLDNADFTGATQTGMTLTGSTFAGETGITILYCTDGLTFNSGDDLTTACTGSGLTITDVGFYGPIPSTYWDLVGNIIQFSIDLDATPFYYTVQDASTNTFQVNGMLGTGS